MDTAHIRSILDRNALCEETMTEERIFAVKEEMEKAEARKLQPYFIRSFFIKAFEQVGGSIAPREKAAMKSSTFLPLLESVTAAS